MKIFNKITALALASALLLISLVSCTPKEESYKATVKTSFSSNDAEMAEAIAAFEKSGVILYVSGNNMKLESSTKIADVQLDRSYVAFDGILYNTTALTAGDKSANEMQKAPFGTAEKAEILLALGAVIPLDESDFNTVNESATKEMVSYTCSGIKEDASASLVSFFADKLDAIDATIALVDVQYNVDTLDGKVQNYILNASFEITVGGNTYSINMTVECEYDYKANVKILAPEGDFTEVTYKDIIG